mgnify:CR=1 FL=1
MFSSLLHRNSWTRVADELMTLSSGTLLGCAVPYRRPSMLYGFGRLVESVYTFLLFSRRAIVVVPSIVARKHFQEPQWTHVARTQQHNDDLHAPFLTLSFVVDCWF